MMRGCLTLPFRILFLVLLAAGLVLAWTYRHELRRRIHAWTADPETEAEGRADPGLVPGARARLAEVGRARTDSIVLTAAQVASLLAAQAEQRVPGAVDSITVRLQSDEVEIRGRIATRLVRTPLGPAGQVLREREWLEAGGPVAFRRAGLAEWRVERVRVRGLPIPRTVLAGWWRQFAGATDGIVAVPLPASVGGLRVTPEGLVLYGTRASR
ncbi:MAG: hypothetical protein ACT4PM_01005 [Gemmatimonadales bacterium]